MAKASGRFFNAGNQCVIRLLTPLGMRYEDTYVKTFPFDKLVKEMLQPEMVLETVDIMQRALDQGIGVNILVNNRAGGNAPLIAQALAEKFVSTNRPKTSSQMSLW